MPRGSNYLFAWYMFRRRIIIQIKWIRKLKKCQSIKKCQPNKRISCLSPTNHAPSIIETPNVGCSPTIRWNDEWSRRYSYDRNGIRSRFWSCSPSRQRFNGKWIIRSRWKRSPGTTTTTAIINWSPSWLFTGSIAIGSIKPMLKLQPIFPCLLEG